MRKKCLKQYMGGKKALIISIAVSFFGIVGYLMFSGDEDTSGGGSSFSGSGGGSFGTSDTSKGSKNFRKEMNRLEVEKNKKNQQRNSDKNKDGSTVINQINDVTSNNKDGDTNLNGGGSSVNNSFSYKVEGDDTTSDEYKKNTQFSIGNSEDDDQGDSGLGAGDGSGNGNGKNITRSSLSASLEGIENTAIFQQCIKIVSNILNKKNPSYTNILQQLKGLSGFKLLSQPSQDSLIGDIINRKYGYEANQYCHDIVAAIEGSLFDLEIYKQCIDTVGKILEQENITQDRIRMYLAEITGFTLLKDSVQDGFATDIHQRKHGDEVRLYCLEIVTAIIDAIEGQKAFAQCMIIVEGLFTEPELNTKIVKSALMTLVGFTLVPEDKQDQFIQDIVIKKHGTNAFRYCMDIVSAIVEAMDPAMLFKKCMEAMENMRKATMVGGEEMTEKKILIHLSVMGVFNGTSTHDQRKALAQTYFGEGYEDTIIEIQQVVNIYAYDDFISRAEKLCIKIVSSIIESINGENLYGECILILAKAKEDGDTNTSIQGLIPSVSELDIQNQYKIENMFKAFLQGNGDIEAEDVCSFLVQNLISSDNALLSLDVDTNADDGTKGSGTLGGDDKNQNDSCVNLIAMIDTKYNESLQNPGQDYIGLISGYYSREAQYQFFIPNNMEGEVIDKTLRVYLNKPVVVENLPRHIDTDLTMDNDAMQLFSSLTQSQRGTIAARLYDLMRNTMSKVSANAIKGEPVLQTVLFPNLCKCSHPDFDKPLWDIAVESYISSLASQHQTQSLPSDPIERERAIISSSFFKKCRDAVKNLSVSDNTKEKIFAKLMLSLPTLNNNNVRISNDDASPLLCYSSQCTTSSLEDPCPLSCEKKVDSVCSVLTASHLESTPSNDIPSPEKIFQCAPSGDDMSLIGLRCLELADKYYFGSDDNQENFKNHCISSSINALKEFHDNAREPTQKIVHTHFSTHSNDDVNREIYTNLSAEKQHAISESIWKDIDSKRFVYQQALEKSCYSISAIERLDLALHFDRGLAIFREVGEAVKKDIIEELWKQNKTKRIVDNRPITSDVCTKVQKEVWSDVINGITPVRSGEKDVLALPPSERCRCYVHKIYLNLHKKSIHNDAQCLAISSHIKEIIADMETHLEDSTTDNIKLIQTLMVIPHFRSLPYNIKSLISQNITDDMAINKSNAPSSKADIEIIFANSQTTHHCKKIEEHTTSGKGYTTEEMENCMQTVAALTYLDTKSAGANQSNIVCKTFADSLKRETQDSGHIKRISASNKQLEDIRLSTCTQKLRAAYYYIEGIQNSYWEKEDYDRTVDDVCIEQSNFYFSKNAEMLSNLI